MTHFCHGRDWPTIKERAFSLYANTKNQALALRCVLEIPTNG